MQHGDALPSGPGDDDLADLLAPVDVVLSPGPATSPRRGTPAAEVPTAPEPDDDVPEPEDYAAPKPDEAATPGPAPEPRTERPVAGVHPAPDGVVTFGRWFQPLPGGVLPRPADDLPLAAAVRAPGGSTVHAVTSGRAHRAPVALAAGGLELAADDGSTIVLTGPPSTTWFRDDEDVQAGEVLGVLPTGGSTDPVVLTVLVIGPDGRPRDAVDLLVGLPDPGELGLGAGLGTDPFLLDLEVAGRLEPDGRS